MSEEAKRDKSPESPAGNDDADLSAVEERINRVRGGKVLLDRSCTDPCFIIVALLFVVGWAVVLVVAHERGRPERLVLPGNYAGDLCGDTDNVAHQPNLFIPRPSRLSYGLCVEACPAVGDFVCNNDIEPMLHNGTEASNSVYGMTLASYIAGPALVARCGNPLGPAPSCNATEVWWAHRWSGLNVKLSEWKCFQNFYVSGATLLRCIPFQDDAADNMTLAEQLGETAEGLQGMAETVGAGSFLMRGFAEMQQAWLVIAICCLTCAVLAFLWVFLLRFILAPLVYACILLILVLFLLLGFFAMWMANDLEEVQLPGDTATRDQVRLWRAVQWTAFILACMYFLLMTWLLKRIKIAIAIMREAALVFLSAPTLVAIPPVTLLMMLCWLAFFIVTTVYIQTIGTLESGTITAAATGLYGDTVVNATLAAANLTGAASEVRVTTWTPDEQIKGLHAYNFFGFLWFSNFCMMYGFFAMALTATSYYFSATSEQMELLNSQHPEAREQGLSKHTPAFAVLRAVWAALRYHLGTILFGSLLIAIVQFIRALVLYLEENVLKQWKESVSVQVLMKCINCCLWCIEQVIRIISKNAFVYCCINNTSFLTSAVNAVGLLGRNIARVGILSMLSTVAFFVLKMFIVGTNMVVAFFLMRLTDLTEGKEVESGLFPMVGILVVSFVIASLFINVYEACTDTVLMCVLVDEEEMKGAFLNAELSELLGTFEDAERARLAYEEKIVNAANYRHESAEPVKEEGDDQGPSPKPFVPA